MIYSTTTTMQRSAKLIDDATFVTAQAKQSAFPGDYHLGMPPHELFRPSCTAFSGGCRSFPTAESGRTFPSWTRPNERPETELFGVAPLKARGDGTRTKEGVDVSSTLRWGEAFRVESCSRRLTELDYDRWECIGAPLQVEKGVRGGMPTRMGMQYFSPCGPVSTRGGGF